MTGGIRELSRLRDEARQLEREAEDARKRRDDMAAWLRLRGWDAKWVGSAAGLAPSFVDDLARRRAQRQAEVSQ